MTPEERFASIVGALAGEEDVTGPGSGRGFGSDELKVGGRIFAMLSRGRLVVKLPRKRVDELVADGVGERYDPRRDGRLMKEWLAVDPAVEEAWMSLATDALEFVRRP